MNNYPYRNPNMMRSQPFYGNPPRLPMQNRHASPVNSLQWHPNQDFNNYMGRNPHVNQPYQMQDNLYQNIHNSNLPHSRVFEKQMVNQNTLQQMHKKFGNSVNQDLIKDLEMLVSDERYQPDFNLTNSKNFSQPSMSELNLPIRKYPGSPYNEISSASSSVSTFSSQNISKSTFLDLKMSPDVSACSQFDNSSFSVQMKPKYVQAENFANVDHTLGMSQQASYPQMNPSYERIQTSVQSNFSPSKNAYFEGKTVPSFQKQDPLYGDIPSPMSSKRMPVKDFCVEKSPHLFKTTASNVLKENVFDSQSLTSENIEDLFSTSMQCSSPFQSGISTYTTSPALQSTFTSCSFSNISVNQGQSFTEKQIPNSSDLEFKDSNDLLNKFPKDVGKSSDASSFQRVHYSEQNVNQCYSSPSYSSLSLQKNIMPTTSIVDSLPSLDSCVNSNLADSVDKTFPTKLDDDISRNDWLKSDTIPFIGEKDSNKPDTSAKKSTQNDYGLNNLLSELSREQKFPSDTLNQNIFQDPSNPKATSNSSDASGENEKKNDSSSKDQPKLFSALEEALDTLMVNDPVIGLEYITENKKNLFQPGSFPFRCKLCNSSITRPKIIDHVLSPKHRLRYLKIRNEKKYDEIISLNEEQSVKDAKVSNLAAELELQYGRGTVIIETEVSDTDKIVFGSCSKDDNSAKEDDFSKSSVWTFDKIPIGFEALSPSQDLTSSFELESPKELKESPSTNSDFKTKNAPLFLATNTDSIVPYLDDSSDSSSSPKKRKSSPKCDFPISNANESPSEERKKASSPVFVSPVVESLEPLKINQNRTFEMVESLFPDVTTNGNKRPASPFQDLDDRLQKMMKKNDDVSQSMNDVKVENSEELKVICSETKDESTDLVSEKKVFDSSALENLSKCIISNEEEATVALQTVNVLMKMLLRYKLQHIPSDTVENLVNSLPSNLPGHTDDILNMLKKKGTACVKNELKDETPSKVDLNSQNTNFTTAVKENIPSSKASISVSPIQGAMSSHESVVSSSHLSVSKPLEMSNIVQSSNVVISTSVPITSSSSMSTSFDTVQNFSTAANSATGLVSSSVSPMCIGQPNQMGASCLRPPPFFGWSQANDASLQSNQPPVTQVNQTNMMWNTHYQASQTQYSYYPQQSFNSGHLYANTAYGSQYQSPVPLVPNAMHMQMPQAPLPSSLLPSKLQLPPPIPDDSTLPARNNVPPPPPPIPPPPPPTEPPPPIPQF